MAVKLGNGKWAVKENNLLAYNDNSGQFFNKEFDFTRGSSATYVGKDGLIKTAGLQDTNLVQNGDFSQLGSELVTNGDFATDSDWSGVGSNGFSISGGKLILTDVAYAKNVAQANVTTVGKTYKVTFEVSDYVKGAVRIFLGGAVTPIQTSNGVFTSYVTAIYNGAFGVQTFSGDGTTLSIDNVSVKEVDPNDEWGLGNGWSIGDGVANYNDNANDKIAQNVNLNAGIYKLKFSISNTTGNGGRIWIGNFGGSVSYTDNSYQDYTNGDYIININVPSNQTSLAFWGNTGGNSFSISNISVQEIQVNTPRIDFSDSADGALLLEPQSTNLIPNANQYTGNTVYYTVTPNQSSPDGENNATLFVEKTSTSNYSVNSQSASVVGGQTYSYSFFIKYAGKQNIPVNATDGVSGFISNIDILNGTVNSGNAEIKDFGNGWYRVSMTRTVNASASSASIQFNFGNQTGDGNSGFYLFGYQIEQLPYATSYIPTQGSASTRIAEICNNSGSAQDFNSEEGVLYAEIKPISEGSGMTLSDGTISNRVRFHYQYGTDIRGSIRIANSQVNIIGGGNISDAYHKIALRWDDNTNILTFYKDGSLVGSVSYSGSLGANTLNNFSFTQGDGATSNFHGKVKSVEVFTTALSDGKIYLLTVKQYQSYQEMATALNYTL